MKTKILQGICDLLNEHILQNSTDNREYKDLLCQKLFYLMEQLKEADDSTLSNHIYSGFLYCYTTLSFEILKNINKSNPVYLCCSKDTHSYNQMCRLFSDPYKYFYRFQTKQGSINIDVNSFLNNHRRQHENEVIVALPDIVKVDVLHMGKQHGEIKKAGYHWKQNDEEKQG